MVPILALMLALMLTGCRQMPDSRDALVSLTPPEESTEVYVILPAYYAGYMSEGLVFESDGEPEDLPVYHTAEEAARALRAFEAQAERNCHIWRIYRLDADWNKDVVPQDKEYRLRGSAKLVEPLPNL